MPDPKPPVIWTFRLKLATGLAVFVLAVMFLRARAERSDIEARRRRLHDVLVRLVDLQQQEYARSGRYATELAALGGWTGAAGIMVSFRADDDQDWRAIASDPALTIPPSHCGVFLGRPSTAPHRAVIEPGIPACW